MATMKKFEMPENYIYISHLDEGYQFWRLPFWPDSISDTMRSTFGETQALGRSAPVYTFSNAGPRQVQFQIKLHRDMMDDVNMNWSNAALEDGEDYLDALIRALQSIAVPKYNLSNKAVEPPLIAIKIGDEVFCKGILSSEIGLTKEKPILSNNKYAQCSLSITVSEIDPYDATTVYKNGSFRGVVNTLKKGMNIGDDRGE